MQKGCENLLFQKRNLTSDNLLPLEGLALLMEHDLYVSAYDGIRKKTKNTLPPYNKILAAKKDCRPSGIVASETAVEVPMQQLSNHTAARILSDPDIDTKVRHFQSVQIALDVKMIVKANFDLRPPISPCPYPLNIYASEPSIIYATFWCSDAYVLFKVLNNCKVTKKCSV